MSLAFDEYGRPFIILRVGLVLPDQTAYSEVADHLLLLPQEQEKKQRIRGIDAQKANIQAAKAVARVLRSSLGPKGMDKMLQSGDGDVCISKSLFAMSPVSHDCAQTDRLACLLSQPMMVPQS